MALRLAKWRLGLFAPQAADLASRLAAAVTDILGIFELARQSSEEFSALDKLLATGASPNLTNRPAEVSPAGSWKDRRTFTVH